MLALQEAAESHLVGLFEDANLCKIIDKDDDRDESDNDDDDEYIVVVADENDVDASCVNLFYDGDNNDDDYSDYDDCLTDCFAHIHHHYYHGHNYNT